MVAKRQPSIKVYVEGGGDEKSGRTELRKALSTLAGKSSGSRPKPTFIPSGGGPNAVDEFEVSLNANEPTLLLVDSAKPYDPPAPENSPWDCHSLKGKRPPTATDEHCHLMVTSIEAWVLADRKAVQSYYGKDFAEGSLPRDPRAKDEGELKKALKAGSKECQRNSFDESHSPKILATCDAALIRQCPWADRFFRALGA